MPTIMVPIHRYTDVYADAEVQLQPIYDTPDLLYGELTKKSEGLAPITFAAGAATEGSESAATVDERPAREVLYFDDPTAEAVATGESQDDDDGCLTTLPGEDAVPASINPTAIDLEDEVRRYFVTTRGAVPPPPPVTDVLEDELGWYDMVVALPFYDKCVHLAGSPCPQPPPLHHSAGMSEVQRRLWMRRCRCWWQFVDELYHPHGKLLEVAAFWTWDPYSVESSVRYCPQWCNAGQTGVEVMIDGIEGHDSVVRYMLPPPPECDAVMEEYVAHGMSVSAAEELLKPQLTRWWRGALIWAAVFSARVFRVCPPPSTAPSLYVWGRSCAQWYGFIKADTKSVLMPPRPTLPQWPSA